MRLFSLALILLSFQTATAAAEEPAKIPPAAQKAIQERDLVKASVEMQPKPENGKFHSIFPVAGYNPTYGVFAGGGYFWKLVEESKMRHEWSLVGIISQKKAVKMELRTNLRISDRWRFEMRNELANGFESNYGEGNDTLTANRVDVELWKNEIEAFFPYAVNKRLEIGPYFESRMRHNGSMNPAVVARQVDPVPDKEFSIAGGFKQVLDFRNIPENPSLGWQQSLRAFVGVPYAGPVRSTFTTVDAEIQVFQYLMDKDLVLAHNLAAGVVFGTPPYLSQLRLGGTDRLRGFYYNRFRGKKYYVEQTELRFPIWDLFSGAAFLEFGEATMKHFSRAHVAYGGGLRIGIPPDKLSKVRIDYAISRDQVGLFIDFGHAF